MTNVSVGNVSSGMTESMVCVAASFGCLGLQEVVRNAQPVRAIMYRIILRHVFAKVLPKKNVFVSFSTFFFIYCDTLLSMYPFNLSFLYSLI